MAKGVFYTYTPRYESTFFSEISNISSYDFFMTLAAQKSTLGRNVICAVLRPKHLENLTGPSVSNNILSIRVSERRTFLSSEYIIAGPYDTKQSSSIAFCNCFLLPENQ